MHKGFSLLELIFILLVIAGIFIASYQRYETYKAKQDLAAIEQNVQLLFYQLDLFYADIASDRTKCSDPCKDNAGNNINNTKCDVSHRTMAGEITTTTFKAAYPTFWSTLLKSRLVNNNDAYNVSTSSVFVNANDVDQQSGKNVPLYSHMLQVTLQLADTSNIAWYAQRLGASYKDQDGKPTTLLTWSKKPGSSNPSKNDDLWILSSGLQLAKRTMGIPNYICYKQQQ